MIRNVHERLVDGTPDEVWPILADLGSLYPATSGSFELPDGLHVDAPVIHDGNRYRVAVVDPGRMLWFDLGRALSGGHGFELFPVGERTLVRHTIEGRPGRLFALMWPLMIRRQHDRAMAGTLDNLDRAVVRAHAAR